MTYCTLSNQQSTYLINLLHFLISQLFNFNKAKCYNYVIDTISEKAIILSGEFSPVFLVTFLNVTPIPELKLLWQNFTAPKSVLQSEIKPTLGRLVGFNASHFHGVKAVLNGQRCAIALWFTLDPRYSEAGHDLARNIINELKHRAEGPAPAQSHEEL